MRKLLYLIPLLLFTGIFSCEEPGFLTKSKFGTDKLSDKVSNEITSFGSNTAEITVTPITNGAEFLINCTMPNYPAYSQNSTNAKYEVTLKLDNVTTTTLQSSQGWSITSNIVSGGRYGSGSNSIDYISNSMLSSTYENYVGFCCLTKSNQIIFKVTVTSSSSTEMVFKPTIIWRVGLGTPTNVTPVAFTGESLPYLVVNSTATGVLTFNKDVTPPTWSLDFNKQLYKTTQFSGAYIGKNTSLYCSSNPTSFDETSHWYTMNSLYVNHPSVPITLSTNPSSQTVSTSTSTSGIKSFKIKDFISIDEAGVSINVSNYVLLSGQKVSLTLSNGTSCINWNSACNSCPAYGTVVGTFCNGTNIVEQYADGCCGISSEFTTSDTCSNGGGQCDPGCWWNNSTQQCECSLDLK